MPNIAEKIKTENIKITPSDAFKETVTSLLYAHSTKENLERVNTYLRQTHRWSYTNDNNIESEIHADIIKWAGCTLRHLSRGESHLDGIAEAVSKKVKHSALLNQVSNEPVVRIKNIKEICDASKLVFIPYSYLKKSARIANQDKISEIEQYEKLGVEVYVMTSIHSLDLRKIDLKDMKPFYTGFYQNELAAVITTLLTTAFTPSRIKAKILNEYQCLIDNLESSKDTKHGFSWLVDLKAVTGFNQDFFVRKAPSTYSVGTQANYKKSKPSVPKKALDTKSIVKSKSSNVEFTYQGLEVTKGSDNLFYASGLEKGYKTKSGIQSAIRSLDKTRESKPIDVYKGVPIYRNESGSLYIKGNKKEYAAISGIQSAIRSMKSKT